MQNSVTSEQQQAAKGPALAGGRPYLLAAVGVGLALLLRLVLDPVWMDRLPYVSFFFAVIIVTRFTGLGPSIFAIIAGFLLAGWFFVAPRHSLLISAPLDQFNAFCYFVVCFGILFLRNGCDGPWHASELPGPPWAGWPPSLNPPMTPSLENLSTAGS
jgi:K+-sensing histidine kinase KdpD